MATASRRTLRRTTAAAQPATNPPAAPDLGSRVKFEYVDINDVSPYDWNPRDNAKAVEAVANSIRSFGFIIPVVLDPNNILVAGHTRIEAAKLLGMIEVPCVRADYLTPEQIAAFRVIDNKVAEQAKWDHELLAGEISKLESLGLDWTQFGWQQAEIDCMAQLVAADCLSTETMDNVAQEAAESVTRGTANRGPQSARIVIGEFVTFVPMTEYRRWSEGVRNLCSFSEEEIAAEIKRRLGIQG